MDELKQDVKEIKVFVIELVKQGAIHNTILAEHEKRSTQLETRLTPIEADYTFRKKTYQVILSLLGVSGAIMALLKML